MGAVMTLEPGKNQIIAKDAGHDANWIVVLAQALAHNAEVPAAPSVLAEAPRIVSLSFPDGAGPDLLAPVAGDLRGGMASRIGSDAWCRIDDEDTYFLHATGLGADATRLQWTGVHLPSGYFVKFGVGFAIKEPLPVEAVLEIGWERFYKAVISLTLWKNRNSPCLEMGERAVLDIFSIKAAPAIG
jgi:hypothetical protein